MVIYKKAFIIERLSAAYFQLSIIIRYHRLFIDNRVKKGAESVLDVSGFQWYPKIIELLFECFTSFTQPVVQCLVISIIKNQKG